MNIKPMEPIIRDSIIEGQEWIHQIKWDGIRGITYIDDRDVKIYTKNGNERTLFYPELEELPKLLRGTEATLDGEMVIFDQNQRPSFSHVLVRERVRNLSRISYYSKKYPIKYIIFDILSFNGKDLRDIPLGERNNVLNNNFEKSSNITITDSFEDGSSLYELMKEKNYEGIVSKNINSKYVEGKNHSFWFKTKINKKMLAIICGIKWKQNFPQSILLGLYRENQLYYIGSARIGLKSNDLHLIKQYASELQINNSPCINNKDKKAITWFKPALTCWVSFMEWTNQDSLRHPKIIGFSKEKPEEADGSEYTYDGKS